MQNTNTYQNLYIPKTSTEVFVDDVNKLKCYAMKNNTDIATIIHKMIQLYEQHDKNAVDLYKFYTTKE